MNCKNCGKVLKDTDKFCWACGTTVEIESVPQQEQQPQVQQSQVQQPQVQQAQAWTQPEPQQTQQPQAQQIPVWQPQQQSQQAPVWQNQQAPVWQEAQPQQPVWSEPAPKAPAKAPRKARGAKKKWLPVALIGGAVVAVVAVVLTLFLTGFFDSDEVKVMKAFGKTADAYGQISENLKMPDLSYIEEDQAYSAEMALWVDYIEDMEEINGLGARVGIDYNLPGEKLGMSLTPFYGSADLVTANIKLDGSKAYIGSPELTDDTYYMVNTKTLGADLAPLIPDAEGLEDLGFNVFELVKIIEEYMTIDEAKLKEANENLIKAIEAEKVGSEEMEINGNDIDCDHYEVVIPQDAMEDYVKAIIELMGEMNYGEMVEDILLAMGCPEEVMEDLRYDLEDMNAGEAFEEVEEVLDEVLDMIGDIELDVYLDGGYIMAVVYEVEIEGTEVELILNLGGGDNYVDDLSLRVVADGGEIILASSGNHSGKDGKFTDKTTLRMDAGGLKMTLMTSELSFKSGKGDNFQWTLDMDEIASTVVEVNGSITFSEKTMECSFDEITISQYGDELASVGVEYKIEPFKDNIKVSDTVEILKLSQDEMMEEVQKLGENVQDWAMGLENKIPELIEAFM